MIIQNSEEKKKVLDKLEKLMAMQSSTNPNEVSIASSMMKKMMDKYDISIGMVEKIQKKQVNVDSAIYNTGLKRIRIWMSVLARAVGDYYECRTINASGNINFIGFELDREVACKMFEYLYINIYNASYEFTVDSKGNAGERTRRMNEFQCGACNEIVKRLNEMIKAREEEVKKTLSECTSLVVIKQHEIDLYTKDKFPNLQDSGKVGFDISIDYLFGKAHGQKVGLNVQIGDDK